MLFQFCLCLQSEGTTHLRGLMTSRIFISRAEITSTIYHTDEDIANMVCFASRTTFHLTETFFLIVIFNLCNLVTALCPRPSAVAIAARSIGGADPNRPQKVNQDAFFQAVVPSSSVIARKNICLMGVMDGHGLKGHLVTQFLSKQLPNRIVEQLDNPSPEEEWEVKMKDLANFDIDDEINNSKGDDYFEIHCAIRYAFHQAHIDAINAPDVPAGRSGTTCIACLIDDACIHVAHVGDSKAILVHSDGTGQMLTTETTVSNLPRDAARISIGEGRIDGLGNVWYGPVGISMTRALGDAVMLRAGVVPTPIVQSFPRSDSCTLVVATDGVWDVLSHEDVCGIASNKYLSLEQIVDQITEQARQKWIGDLPVMEEKVDDITCIVAKL